MPTKKRKKFNARFPPSRIKKIMQSDEDVGKVAAAVPVLISRALELFVETLMKNVSQVVEARNARTLTPSHLKRCIHSEPRFDFLRDLTASVPDLQGDLDGGNESSTSAPPTPTVAPAEAPHFPAPSASSSSTATAATGQTASTTPRLQRQLSTPKPRGRPRKRAAAEAEATSSSPKPSTSTGRRKPRGRPGRKKRQKKAPAFEDSDSASSNDVASDDDDEDDEEDRVKASDVAMTTPAQAGEETVAQAGPTPTASLALPPPTNGISSPPLFHLSVADPSVNNGLQQQQQQLLQQQQASLAPLKMPAASLTSLGAFAEVDEDYDT